MIEIENLSMKIGDFSLADVNLMIQDKEYLVILGPTGAGKTVLMECLAGLHRIKHGMVRIDGVDVTRWSPEERGIGYVPQDYVLFPFLNVQDNIIFGLRRGRHSQAEIRRRLFTLVDLLGIGHLLARDTRTLSGGEKQRVALARALATAPRILLMDEPFSALDVQTSNYLRLELRRIHHELGVTSIHITHNQVEADEMADRIAVMIDGRIVQAGTPQDIFFNPENEAVSSFTGVCNVLECDSCKLLAPGLVEAICRGMRIVLPHDHEDIKKIAISPHDIYVSAVLPPGSSVNRYSGFISEIAFDSATAIVTVDVEGVPIRAEMPAKLVEDMNLTRMNEVYVLLKLRKLRVLSGKEGAVTLQYRWFYQSVLDRTSVSELP